MPPRWPSSATPASQAPRCGIATFRVSCDQATPPAPVVIASAASAVMSVALVIVVPPSGRGPRVLQRRRQLYEPIAASASSELRRNWARQVDDRRWVVVLHSERTERCPSAE